MPLEAETRAVHSGMTMPPLAEKACRRSGICTECLGLLTEIIDCSYIFLPGFYEMYNLLVRRSDYPKDYQNGRTQEMILVKHSEITKIISNLNDNQEIFRKCEKL